MDTSTSVPMSVAAAAAHARVSTKTIRRWLTAGRLEASRGPDGSWLIELDALDRAIATPGQSVDSPTLAIGHGQVQAIVQDLLIRLEAQAERIGRLDAELVSTRTQLSVAEQRLLALEAPKADSLEITSRRDDAFRQEPTPVAAAEPVRHRLWWQLWRRAHA
jgi:hypothetical protein